MPATAKTCQFSAAPRPSSEDGSTLIMAMVIVSALVLIAASTAMTVTTRSRSNYQTASWHDALTSAESGTQYGLARLRSPLTSATGALVNPLAVPGSLQSDIATLSAGGASVNGAVLTGTYNGAAYTRIQLPTLTIPHVGEGSSQFNALVTIDAVPATSVATSGVNTWYRIQSAGTVPLSGGAYVGVQKYDNFLRKLQFHVNSSGAVLGAPQASRTVEVIAQPITIGSAALFGQVGINLNNQNIVIDSYDSRNAKYSTNGIYDPSKATANANIVTDDDDTSGGTPGVINLSPTGAHINGNVATNDTAVQGSTGHVTGTVTENFYEPIPAAPDPATVSSTWTSVSGSVSTLAATGSSSSPARYEISGNGSLSLSGNSSLNITAPATGQGYAEIWIPGSLSTSGNGAINIPANVHVTFYVTGSVSISGNGIVNSALIPGNVILYGNPNPAANQSMAFTGNASFAGVIYAPGATVSVKGGGSSGDMYGSISASNISFNGQTALHYDQALGDVGAVIDYRIASWYEDNTLTR